MNSIFRKIRKQLAAEDKPVKYLRYAVGEIALIMLGIFFALQLQNWNEQRKEQENYLAILEQVYNSVNYDIEILRADLNFIDFQIETISYLLTYPDSISDDALPWSAFMLSFDERENTRSETNYHAEFLNYSSKNSAQNELTKQIRKYVENIRIERKDHSELIKEYFLDNNIPFPAPPESKEVDFYIHEDSITHHTKEEMYRLRALLKSEKFRTTIKSLRSVKGMYRIFPKNNLEDAQSIMNLIKSYHPEVKITFQDVGIIGTAINGYPDVGAKSTPMFLKDEKLNIWEIEIYLKQGTVKFRCRDSWTQNWGGVDFPKSNTEFDGTDIPIPVAGNYRVILNLTTNTYEFINLD